MRQFWWSANLDKRSIPWIVWDKITLSKKEGGLGIRDMLAFNKALLTKQAWRLMNNPTSLLARVYKAKYFRKTNFLEAKASPSSSYAWRSIIQTQFLNSKGIKWIVGNGENIRLWKDNWLQGDTDLFPTGPGAELYPMMMVKDLFISGTREWDISKIRSLVREEDVAKILRIRPSWTLQQDTLCWRFGTTGTYTVKTGYHLQRSMDIEAQPNQSSNQPQVTLRNNLLNKLWRVNIPPKIKMFWWKATHNGLPVVENLKKRGYESCELCPLCGEKPETVDHMILQCRVAWEIWSLVLNEDRYQLSQISTIYDLMLFCLQKISRDRADNVPFFLGWRIWKARNKLVFENRRDHIIHIINSAYMDANIWKEALTQNKETEQTVSTPVITSVQDILPQQAELYCIVDVSWKSPNENIGIGWSLYSKEGTPILQESSAMYPTSTPLVAEATAMCSGVQQFHNLYYSNVTFLTDCLKLNNILYCIMKGAREQDICHPEMIGMAKEIQANATRSHFNFKHVGRNLVDVVDKLAKEARVNNKSYVISWLYN